MYIGEVIETNISELQVLNAKIISKIKDSMDDGNDVSTLLENLNKVSLIQERLIMLTLDVMNFEVFLEDPDEFQDDLDK